MLDNMRNVANTWVMKIFLGILLVSFAFGGGLLVFGGGSGGSQLLTSGKSSISPIPGQDVRNPLVLQQMRFDVLFDEEARLLDIGASGTGTALLLKQNPAYYSNGQFDKMALQNDINNRQISEQSFFQLINRQARRNQIIQGLFSDIKTPDALADAFSLYQNETRTVDYITLKAENAGSIPDPDKKTLAGWFEKNVKQFQAPEYRQIVWMQMRSGDLSLPARQVTDQDLKAFYEEHRQQYEPLPFETVKNQIRDQLEKAPQDVSAALSSKKQAIEQARFDGKSLPELAKEYGLVIHTATVDAEGRTPDGESAGLPPVSVLLPRIFESLAQVDADPVQAEGGYLWYQVDKIIPARAKTLDEVWAQVIAAWKQEEAGRRLEEKAAAMKKALDLGTPIAKIAADYNLPLTTQQNLKRSGQNETSGQALIQAAFSNAQGATGLVNGDDGASRILFKVVRVTLPAGDAVPALPVELKDGLANLLAQDLVGAYYSYADKAHPVQFNTALYQLMTQQYPEP